MTTKPIHIWKGYVKEVDATISIFVDTENSTTNMATSFYAQFYNTNKYLGTVHFTPNYIGTNTINVDEVLEGIINGYLEFEIEIYNQIKNNPDCYVH